MASGNTAKYTCKYGSTDMLTATNYHAWKRDMEAFLLSEDALDIVEGREQAPNAGSREGTRDASMREAIRDFRRRSGRAYAMITTSCDDSVRNLIDDVPRGDCVAVWKTLKDHLDTSKTRSGRIEIVRRFHRLRMSPDSTISEYISKLRETRKELAGSPEQITDETLTNHLLSTLPGEFSNIVDIITHKPVEEQTLAIVTETLIEYEKKLEARKAEAGAGPNTANTLANANGLSAALRPQHRNNFRRTPYEKTGNASNDSRRQSRDTSDAECWYCLQKGHMQRECDLKRRANDLRNQRVLRRAQGNAAYIDNANPSSIPQDVEIDGFMAGTH
jgi:uncharacterized protein YheU (UPF0270 family)